MLLFQVLKLVLGCWFLLLIIQSVSHDFPTLVLLSGVIITSMPFAIFLAWIAGVPTFRSVVLLSLFILIVIALHITQLAFG